MLLSDRQPSESQGACTTQSVPLLRRLSDGTLRCCLSDATACRVTDVTVQHLRGGTAAVSELLLFCQAACRMVHLPLLRFPEWWHLVLPSVRHCSSSCMRVSSIFCLPSKGWRMRCCVRSAAFCLQVGSGAPVEPFETWPMVLLPAECDPLAWPCMACQSQPLTLGSQQA